MIRFPQGLNHRFLWFSCQVSPLQLEIQRSFFGGCPVSCFRKNFAIPNLGFFWCVFFGDSQAIHTLKLTVCPWKMVVSNRNLLFQGSIFRGCVRFREGLYANQITSDHLLTLLPKKENIYPSILQVYDRGRTKNPGLLKEIRWKLELRFFWNAKRENGS